MAIHAMQSRLLLSLLVTCCIAQADCASSLPLKGAATIEKCDRPSANCVPAQEALYAYMAARKDDDPALLVIGLHGSPWHLYGPDFHILDIDELAAMVRQQGSGIKHVVLLASWSGVGPDPRTPSLAQKLSTELKGMRVTGQDGFVWYAKDGAVQTTQQAFSMVTSGPYSVVKGDKVMASLAAGWPVSLEAEFLKRRDGAGLMRAGVGADIFMLCPEGALRAFDAGAALANPVAAYNAALIRLERDAPGDTRAAIALLKQSAKAGDKRAQAKLQSRKWIVD
jgi:hypothetical protein